MSLGFSPERLARLDRFIQARYVDTGLIPGAQLKIHRGGQTVHEFVCGRADLRHDQALADNAIFRIYSMTKPITSVAFMMLVEEGLVALDDPVAKFIPAWKDLRVFQSGQIGSFVTQAVNRPMQVIDLLRHTSGLTYGFQNRTNVDASYRKHAMGELGSSLSLDDMISLLGTLPLEFSPGSAWNYSVSTDVLGYLVGVISGMAFETFLQTRIFDPLGMSETGFQVADGQGGRLPACYYVTPGGLILQDDPATSPYLKAPGLISGGGGLVSTAADYMKFCDMLVARGLGNGHQLIAPKTLDLMTANHLPDGKDLIDLSVSPFSESAYPGVGFGLGFAVVNDPARAMLPGSVGEFYWGGAASTAFWIDPVEDLSVVFMTQVIPSSAYPIRRQLRTLVYSALVETYG